MDYVTNYNFVMQFGISNRLQFISNPLSTVYWVETDVLVSGFQNHRGRCFYKVYKIVCMKHPTHTLCMKQVMSFLAHLCVQFYA